jgi:hypothetical protein
MLTRGLADEVASEVVVPQDSATGWLHESWALTELITSSASDAIVVRMGALQLRRKQGALAVSVQAHDAQL